jgi:hypothetical protein
LTKINELQCDQCGKRDEANPNWYRVERPEMRGKLRWDEVISWGGIERPAMRLDFCSALCAAGWFTDRVREND